MLEKIAKNGIAALKTLNVRSEVIDSVNNIIDSVNALAGKKYKAVFDISIVRGQGYYTGAVYEVYVPGFGGACAGGGRYDNMVEKMMGKSVPAVGLGLGFEPTCMLVLEQGLVKVKEDLIACIYTKEDNFADVLNYVENLNKTANASAICAKKNLAFQLENLKANGFTKFVKFGTNKIENL